MRLIDADALHFKCNPSRYVQAIYGPGFYAAEFVIDEAPTIDPNDLPLVQWLWKKIEKLTAERNTALKWVKQLKAEKAAAIGELNGVLASVYRLTEFVDDEVHPVVDYDLYLRLREKVDLITQWEHADEWCQDGENP